MTKYFISFAILLLVITGNVFGQEGDEAVREEIRQTVLKYAEGWYEGDAAKMESSLHTDLAKRTIQTDKNGRSRLQELSSLGLVQLTRPGHGKSTPKDKRQKDIKILDIYHDMATVRLEMQGWVDYMHVGKFSGKWVIVNVLWEPKPRKEEAKD